jgi:hypothetical protein
MYGMSSVATHSSQLSQAPKLRLLPKRGTSSRCAEAERPALRLLAGRKPDEQPVLPVLLAGGGAAARAEVLRDMARTMPPSTVFEQAGAIWEVLARSPECSMVILSGELEEIPAASVMQMLVHRSPEVPVVCLDAAEPHELGRPAPPAPVQALAR